MRYFVSDIHGEYALFERLLEGIGFCEADEMFVCGDIIDKGPASVRLLGRVMRMKNLHAILGNHELAFLNTYHALSDRFEGDPNGLLARLRAYFPEDGELLTWEMVDYLESLPAYIEGEDFICVHAGIPGEVSRGLAPLSSVDTEVLVQDRKFKDPAFVHTGQKCVFFGHTQTDAIVSEPRVLAYRRRGTAFGDLRDYYKVHLDTGSWSNGVLGCFIAESGKVVYAKKAAPTK